MTDHVGGDGGRGGPELGTQGRLVTLPVDLIGNGLAHGNAGDATASSGDCGAHGPGVVDRPADVRSRIDARHDEVRLAPEDSHTTEHGAERRRSVDHVNHAAETFDVPGMHFGADEVHRAE